MQKSKRLICSLLSVVMVLTMFAGLNLTAYADNVSTASSEIHSSHRTKETTYSGNKKKQSLMAVNDINNDTVLLIQSNDPWDTDSNSEVLTELVDQGKVASYDIVSMENAVNKDFSEYTMVMFANDQAYDSYRQYIKIKNGIEKYVYSGGCVLFGACDNGWANGNIDSELPGSVTKYMDYSNYNYIVDSSYPAINGSITKKSAMTDDMLYGTYCSHTCFNEETLPGGSKVILRSSDTDDPTLVEYSYGDGTVIASGLTWEFYYNGRHSDTNCGYADYYEDLILYSVSLGKDLSDEQEGYTVDSGFKINTDANSFVHTSGTGYANAGFVGVKNYQISDEYYNKLVNQSSKSEKSAIKSYMKYGPTGHWSLWKTLFEGGDYWKGSCYGIAASMGMLYENYIPLSQLSSVKTNNYHSLMYPYKNEKLLNAIQYFQISQKLAKGGKSSAAISYTVNDSNLKNQEYDYDNLRTFLKKMVETASNGDVTLFGFSQQGGGHAVLITGCISDPANHRYLVKIYDENSVGSSGTGAFSYMVIPYDFRSFSYREASGDTLNNENYTAMYILDWSKMKQLDGSTKGNEHIVNDGFDNDLVTLSIATDECITIENESGEYFNYSDGNISGDMYIYSLETIEGAELDGEDASPYFKLTVEASSDFYIYDTSDRIEVEVYDDDDDYLLLAANNIDEARVSLGNGIDLTGEEYTFTACMSTDELVNNDEENNLISVTANASDDTSIIVNGENVEVQSDEDMTDISVSNYIGTDAATITYEENNNLIIGNILDEHQHQWDVGKITKPATVTQEGVKTYTCIVCSETKTEVIPKLSAQNGWVTENGKKYYYKDNTPLKWRQKIGNSYYYFNGAGVMQTGWIKGGTWMYGDTKTGALKIGWFKVGGKWYWFKSDGSMVAGWQKISGKWYYFNTSGAMVSGWQKISGKWYYFNASGAMVTGWQKISNKWYYFNSSGAMQTGWLKSGGKWYYFNTDGAMVTGTRKIGSKTYRFNSSGTCLNP